MSESFSSPRALENTFFVPPRQRRAAEIGGYRVLGTARQVANAAMNEIVVVGNRTVFGLLGDCMNEATEGAIETIKGEARKGKPLGLTIPFTHEVAARAFDTKHLNDKRLYDFMEPEALTLIVGGLGFVRGIANREAIEDDILPKCVLSRPDKKSSGKEGAKPLVQIYSPAGNKAASEIISLMLRAKEKALPIMSSANKSGEPEITTTADALVFAQKHDLPISIDMPDSEREDRPQMSYPIFLVKKRKIHIPRQGFLDKSILRPLLHGLPVSYEMPPHPRPAFAEAHMLRLVDLIDRYPNAARYTGPDMRKCLLEYLGIG